LAVESILAIVNAQWRYTDSIDREKRLLKR
jgi:hypothetical protein